MSNAAKKIIDRLSTVKLAFSKLAKTKVLVGVPKGKERKGKERKGKEAMNNATIAYIMDRGSPAQNIPARPFMTPGIKNAQSKITKQLYLAANRVLVDPKEAPLYLNRAGLVAQNSIRAMINSDIQPALAKGTLAARRRRGRTGTKTLIDTGQLRNSITYVVKTK